MAQEEKFYPSGIVNPDYVESLFDQLIESDKKRLAEKIAGQFGFVTEEEAADYDLEVIRESMTDFEILEELDDDEILDYAVDKFRADVLLRNVGFDDVVKVFDSEELLDHISDDEIYYYFMKNGLGLQERDGVLLDDDDE